MYLWMSLFMVTWDFNLPMYAVVEPLTERGAWDSNTTLRTYSVHSVTFNAV